MSQEYAITIANGKGHFDVIEVFWLIHVSDSFISTGNALLPQGTNHGVNKLLSMFVVAPVYSYEGNIMKKVIKVSINKMY